MKKISAFLTILILAFTITMGSAAVFAVPGDTDDTPNENTTEEETERENNTEQNQEEENTDNNTQEEENQQEQETTYTPNYYNTYTEPEPEKLQDTISILFTHDMHSHLETEGNNRGFAKMKTLIDETIEENDNTFLLDAGDFSMGTPFQTIFSSEAAELRMMAHLGYDAVTLGNHEFDYKLSGLNHMLKAAMSKTEDQETLPKLVMANIDWDKTLEESSQKDSAEELQKTLDKYGMKTYETIEKEDFKIAVFGILGEEAEEQSPESGMYFRDPIEASKDVVEEIQSKEKDIDLIVCLSHSGTEEIDGEISEDETLAREVDGIDLIVSGHSHTELEEPVEVEGTTIVACGQYTDNMGSVTYKKESGSNFKLEDYELLAVNKDVEADYNTGILVDEYKAIVNSTYFSKFGYTMDQVLARNSIAFTPIDEFALKQGEDTLGDLIADSYIYSVEKATKEKPDVAVVPAGIVRASLDKGNLTVGDIFNVSSLGIGPDGVSGYPLVKMYLTGKEIRNVAEVDISISPKMPEARLYCSGISYTYNPNRFILNRVSEIGLVENNDDSKKMLENDELYCVVADLYTCQMLGVVEDKSYGLLAIEPKDKDGNVIESADYEKYIVYENKTELKAWRALADYVDSFRNDRVPGYYSSTHDRKVLDDSHNIIDLLKNPNKVGWLLYGGIVLIILIIIVIILIVRAMIIKKTGGRQKQEPRMFSERQKKKILKRPKRQKNIFSKKRGRRW